MWDLWWTKWHWDRFFLRVLRFFPVSFIPPALHYLEKQKKLITFLTWLHGKPSGGGASLASAAGPSTMKKIQRKIRYSKSRRKRKQKRVEDEKRQKEVSWMDKQEGKMSLR
jgi:hypothetical protein